MAEPVFDAAKGDWRQRETRKPRAQRVEREQLYDGAGVPVSTLPHVTNEGDWRGLLPSMPPRRCVR